MLNGKTILVTGGTGSFGHHFVDYVLAHYEPKKIIRTTNESIFIEKIEKSEINVKFGDIVEEIKFTKKLKFKNLEYYFNDLEKIMFQ